MFTKSDIEWLGRNHPHLRQVGEKIEGRLSFSMAYHTATGGYTVNAPPESALDKENIYHADSYELQLYFTEDPYPHCLEIGGVIESTRKRLHMQQGDMHVNSDGTLCLETSQELLSHYQHRFSLEDYIQRFLIPFLFQQTHYRLKTEWAWKPRAHYESGPLEWYYDSNDKGSILIQDRTLSALSEVRSLERQSNNSRTSEWLMSKQLNREMLCFCKSGKSVVKCCPRALYGYKRLRKELLRRQKVNNPANSSTAVG